MHPTQVRLYRNLPTPIRPNRDRELTKGRLDFVLRALFGPHARRRAHWRLWGLRHETIPALRHRAQARVYRALIQRQTRFARRRALAEGNEKGKGVLSFLFGAAGGGSRRPAGRSRSTQVVGGQSGAARPGRRASNVAVRDDGMAQSRLSLWGPGEEGAGGGRRKKIYEYLRAANELRQSYSAQWQRGGGARGGGYEDDFSSMPGAFPDVEIARSGDEEMVIFPSYARRLVKRSYPDLHPRQRRDSYSTIDEYRQSSEDLEEWDEFEAENAVVDVDVRGWIYTPHRGPMTRKHRFMIALARKLSGVPAPSSYPSDTGEPSSEHGSTDRVSGKNDEDAVNREAESILNKGQRDGDAAWKNSVSGDGAGRLERSTTSDSQQLTRDELSMANAHLLERLRPFMSNPMSEMPVTVFFFNDEKSQSRNVVTDDSGHFSLRAGLPFVPTHIRVLASEDLSVAKEVEVLEPTGVSLISDIDDTVKHSAIASGAKEIFRNTFVRELADLAVDGVAQWYSKLVKLGVEFHYVSNAPWQLYPLLERYFKLVGLPPGSFHLKHYTGMLQGIFEPTAERKKTSLERIMDDFPDRKFVLVGDSGEADLEVYTELVMANPGRILGIFIRDVTTPNPKKFFERSWDHQDTDPSPTRTTGQLGTQSHSIPERPALPPRPPREETGASSLDNGDLIDLRDDDEKPAAKVTPTKPAKPSSLRAVSTTDEKENGGSFSQAAINRKPVPPVPPRRRAIPTETSRPSSNSTESYISSVKNTVQNAANAVPCASDYLPTSSAGSQSSESRRQPPPIPPPRRTNTATPTGAHPADPRQQQSYPASAASAASSALQFASERLNIGATPQTGSRTPASNQSLRRTATSNSVGTDYDYGPGSAPPASLPNKREELWRRRWERASEQLQQRGVVLGSWRVGEDVQDVCIWLVEEAMKEIKKDQGRK